MRPAPAGIRVPVSCSSPLTQAAEKAGSLCLLVLMWFVPRDPSTSGNAVGDIAMAGPGCQLCRARCPVVWPNAGVDARGSVDGLPHNLVVDRSPCTARCASPGQVKVFGGKPQVPEQKVSRLWTAAWSSCRGLSPPACPAARTGQPGGHVGQFLKIPAPMYTAYVLYPT